MGSTRGVILLGCGVTLVIEESCFFLVVVYRELEGGLSCSRLVSEEKEAFLLRSTLDKFLGASAASASDTLRMFRQPAQAGYIFACIRSL